MNLKEFFKGSGSPSALALIAANSVPLAGAILFDWSIFSLMFLFWLENVIVGLLNIIRFLGAVPASSGKSPRVFIMCFQVFLAGFFTFHYGIFCLVHGAFVFGIFGREAGVSIPNGLNNAIAITSQILISEKLLFAALSIFISHLFSLAYNFFYKGERRGANIGLIMFRPYGRVVVLHLTILFGGFATMALGSPVWALVLLVVLKTLIDLKAHLMERAKLENNGTADSI